MNALTSFVAEYVRSKVDRDLKGLPDARSELRCFFHGPPEELLREIFEALADGSVRSSANNGDPVAPPVMLQVSGHEPDFANPAIGLSGLCDESHLMSLRNSPACRQFVVLVPPGSHRNLSISSASSEFGVQAIASRASATVDDWWGDAFVQEVVSHALTRLGLSASQVEEATALVEAGVRALETIVRGEADKLSAWRLVSRLFSIPLGHKPAEGLRLVSLACGFPPTHGELDAGSTIAVLNQIAVELSGGMKTAIERISERAESRDDQTALEGFLKHLQDACEIPSSFGQAPAAYYSPARANDISLPAPEWWTHLTVERWQELLQEPDAERPGLTLRVQNAIAPLIPGGCAVTLNDVAMLVSISADDGMDTDVVVNRYSGGKTPSMTWGPRATGAVVDTDTPPHKAPLRYSAVAEGFKSTAIKAISLSSWEPGIYVYARSASKLSPSRPGRGGKYDLEASIDVLGIGRHLFEVLIGPNITLVDDILGRDAAGDEVGEDNLRASPQTVADHHAVFEIDVPGDCYLDIAYRRRGTLSKRPEILHLSIACEEAVTASCGSEFERAILLNRPDDTNRRQNVHVDRQVRLADLQSWCLSAASCAQSFMPVVLATDCDEVWTQPDWSVGNGPVFSRATFLQDPRPGRGEFEPNSRYLAARCAIAEKVRGDDGSGLIEEVSFGELARTDPQFVALVEEYLDAYQVWLASAPTVAMWSDLVAVVSITSGAKTLEQEPDAVLMSPLHPVRLAWHCAAQTALHAAVWNQAPCPAASILDPDAVPDSFSLPVRATDGGILLRPFISVESSSDYWAVLWNGGRLSHLEGRLERAPFGMDFGLTVGGIARGFSPAQVVRSLGDTAAMFCAKPRLAVVISQAAGGGDACTAGIMDWARARWMPGAGDSVALGPGTVDVYDLRVGALLRPDEAAISTLTEDTGGAVRWFSRRPDNSIPDLGIIAQLGSTGPQVDERNESRSPLAPGALIRHRVRRQLPGGGNAFLVESRQGLATSTQSNSLLGKLGSAVARLESIGDARISFSFAPSVATINEVLRDECALLVAVSSSSVDPACFLGGWLQDAYLWDYQLPSFSRRAGDTNGYYLISQVRDAEREGLRKGLERLPIQGGLSDDALRDTLLEIARRGIPTVRGISSDDTSGTGELGLFVASRLLQDGFRSGTGPESLLSIFSESEEGASIALVIPVDPFRGYIDDLARALKRDKRELTFSRPDLVVICARISDAHVALRITPVEVKCRQTMTMTAASTQDALRQAKSLSLLLQHLSERGSKEELVLWRLASQHLLLSMLAFGMRVYSQRIAEGTRSRQWSNCHERIAAAVLGEFAQIEVDETGRLIVIEKCEETSLRDLDGDGFDESVSMSLVDAATIVGADAQTLYAGFRAKLSDWRLMPQSASASRPIEAKPSPTAPAPAPMNGGEMKPVDKAPETTRSTSATVVPPPQNPSETEPAVSTSTSTSPQDAMDNGIVVKLGELSHAVRSTMRTLSLSDTRLNQLNIGVVGDLGTGKTQLLKSFMFQVATSSGNAGVKPRFLIFDYKNDYASEDFVRATGAKVVAPKNLPLNMFSTSGLTESLTPWLDRFNFFADVLDKIYSGIGFVQRNNLKQAVRSAYEQLEGTGREPTIYDVHASYSRIVGQRPDSPFAIMDDIVDRQVFSRQPTGSGGFAEFFDGVVVISLSSLGQDDKAKNMVVAVMLNMFYEHMLKIPKRPYRGSNPQLRVIDSFLLVDEADNIMKYEFDVLRKVLLQGREFGVGVILASQYLKHYKVNTTDYKEPLLTWLIHKVPNVTAQELGALGFTADLAELSAVVKSLPNHHYLFKSAGVSGEVIEGLPFYRLIG